LNKIPAQNRKAPPESPGPGAVPSGPAGALEEYLAALKASPRFGPQVVHHEELAGQPPCFAELANPLPPELRDGLARQGISGLYSHQAAAIDLIRQGKDVIVATSTASGKSLIYNIPVFENLLIDVEASALYLFPLKALAQDQLKGIEALAAQLDGTPGLTAAICDGDTSAYRRKKLREQPPRILITNPDMLHLSMLGYHERWARLWASLTHVVIDEVHTYRGVFGSHMAWVLRRLFRLCRFYGREPRFLLSSATVGNPGELARDLLGRSAEVITESGAPRATRHFLFIDPLDSAALAASQLLEAAIKRGLRSIVYTQSRKMAELVSLWTQGRLGEMASKLAAYRAGFLPEDRRRIEAGLAGGELLGVVSTSALELGIDIGELDICILVGYPGTVMATWQRSGRVGRRERDSLILLVGHEDALDQYFLRHPQDFFNRPVESAVLNPENEIIAERHLLCSAAELPIAVADPLLASAAVGRVVAKMAGRGDLLLGGDGKHWYTGRKYPHREVDLRGSGRSYLIRLAGAAGKREGKNDCRRGRSDSRLSPPPASGARPRAGGAVLGEVDGGRCFRECHPGAVYLHQGETWLVTVLDLEAREVTVIPKKLHYFTRTLGSKETEILEVTARVELCSFRASLGRLRVTETITGFQKRLVKGQKLIGREDLDLPPQIFETEGLWFEIPAELQDEIEREQIHFMGGIHAVEHACIAILPLLVLCDRNDLGGISQPFHPQLNRAAVFIYDGHPGGVGLCRQAFERIKELLVTAQRIIGSCPCEVGCPSCVHSPKCGSGNRPIDKAAALRVLAGLLTPGGRQLFSCATVQAINHANDQTLKRPTEQKPGSKFSGDRGNSRGAGEWLIRSGATRVPAAYQEEIGLRPGKISAPAPDPEPDDSLLAVRYGVFDLETKRSAAEVGGWHRAERMGISVAVLYDSALDQYLTFREGEIGALVEHLARLDLVVGFNNKRFDNRVLSAYTSFALHSLPTLDILEEVKNRLGYRLSLDHLTEHTLGVKKTGNGLQALEWYKEGRIEELIDYCRQDVRITRELLLYGAENRYLLFRNKAGQLVRCPVEFTATAGPDASSRWCHPRA
jgi:DEAD/DEAH box helicase domain-containing protein